MKMTRAAPSPSPSLRLQRTVYSSSSNAHSVSVSRLLLYMLYAHLSYTYTQKLPIFTSRVTRRSSGVAPRACVRVYARVLVLPNLYIHTLPLDRKPCLCACVVMTHRATTIHTVVNMGDTCCWVNPSVLLRPTRVNCTYISSSMSL